MEMVNFPAKRMDVRAAAEDMRGRTLSRIARPLDRLIYLASLRDYNTGFYYHEGLAARFSEEAVCEALSDCHREVFRQLLFSPLEDLVAQLEAYVDSTNATPADFIAAWQRLEPYRVSVPAETDSVSAGFFFSNLKVALAILRNRLRAPRLPKPSAWRQPSLGR
jgi:hypothetical protein